MKLVKKYATKKSAGCYENIQFSLSFPDKCILRRWSLNPELNNSRCKTEMSTE